MRAATIKLMLAGGLLAALAAVGWGEAPPAPAAGGDQKFKYRTAADCLRCHEGPSPVDLRQGVTDRVHMTEGSVWSKQDKHSQAYEVLKNCRSKRMETLLGKKVLLRETGCVACHATNIDDAAWLEQHADAIDQGRGEGVACEACHGASSEWYDMHTLASWRELTDEQKASHGFTQLKDPVVRAEVCLSCHIGDVKRGRVITHEMYAAGHPPLSGFEPESSADRMPRHWRDAYEKPGAAGDADRFVRTRYALAASIVGLRMAVELAAAAPAPGEASTWPELARLDCYGCHHELEPDSWRQQRATRGRSGRTELAVGSVSLLTVAARAADGDDGERGLEASLERLRRPFDKNVFGDVEQLQAAAPDVVAWSRGVEDALRRLELRDESLDQVLRDYQLQASDRLQDYDAARSLGGAARLMLATMNELQKPENKEQIDAVLQQLTADLDLAADKQLQLEVGLQQGLEQRARYRPDMLRKRFQELEQAIADNPISASP